MSSIVNNNVIQITGLSVNSPLVVDGGANGSYAVAAHQIKWDKSKFNGETFGGTSEGLLNAVENSIKTTAEKVSNLYESGLIGSVDTDDEIDNVDTVEYIVKTTADNITLENNKYYKKTNISSSISINLNMPEDVNVLTSFNIEFTTSETGTTVSLPDTIKWLNGELPIFENNFTYQISICNGLGVYAKYA